MKHCSRQEAGEIMDWTFIALEDASDRPVNFHRFVFTNVRLGLGDWD